MKQCFRIQVTQAISNHANCSLSRSVILLFCIIYTCLSLAHAQEKTDLAPFHAIYAAYKWDDELGTAELKLEPLSAGRYSLTYSSEVSRFFLSDKRYEHSIFKLKAGKLIPEQYHYSRSGTGPDKKLKAQFVTSPDKQIVINDSQTFPWKEETDNQLYRIDLPRKLASGGESFTYDFVNYRGELRTYRINVVGKEHLTLPFGALDTIKVKIMRKSNDRETFAWFAPKLDYNLVRLQQFKDGEEQGEIKLKSYTRL